MSFDLEWAMGFGKVAARAMRGWVKKKATTNAIQTAAPAIANERDTDWKFSCGVGDQARLKTVNTVATQAGPSAKLAMTSDGQCTPR